MSLEELAVETQRLASQHEALREERRRVAAAIETLTAEKSAQEKLLAMSPAERKALGLPEPQIVKVDGIESAESVSEV
jgi:hypothetical protein